jgi:hypothetical protein
MSMLISFFDIKGIVHKEFFLAGQTVSSACYCDVFRRLRENVRRLRPELWRQRNWLLHHDSALSHTSFFTRECLTKIKHDCRHPPTLLACDFSPFLRLKITLKGRRFDTIELIEA